MKKYILINLIMIILMIINLLPNNKQNHNDIVENIINEEIVIEELTSRFEESRDIIQESENIIENASKINENEHTDVLSGYRITSYYPSESSNLTGSGKTTNDFSTISINGKDVYSYKGKIVVAGATKELLRSGYSKNGSQELQDKHYFKYYDTGKIKLYDTWYDFIVLDSCGASMWKGYYRIDIFVKEAKDIIDLKNVNIIYNNERGKI